MASIKAQGGDKHSTRVKRLLIRGVKSPILVGDRAL